MALIVEDGTSLVDADSFVSVVEVRAFALGRGVTLSADDTVLEALIRGAHDYILEREDRFVGNRTSSLQALPFPRKCAYLYGEELDDDAIPQPLKNAVCLLVMESVSTDIMPTFEGRVAIQETVGPVATKYALFSSTSTFPRVEAALAPLYSSVSPFRTRRA